MIFVIYYQDFYNQSLIKRCLICKKLTENLESVRKWSVSVHRLYLRYTHAHRKVGESQHRELKSCSVRPALHVFSKAGLTLPDICFRCHDPTISE